MSIALEEDKKARPLPAPNSDFYQLADVLTSTNWTVVKKVRTYMETKVQPIINRYWSDDAFPFELLPSFKELQLGGLGFQGYGCAGGSQKLFGFVAMELARVDASFCTLLQCGQRPGNGSIYLDGSWRSRSRSGCHQWRVGKRSVASALPSRWSVRERAEG